MTSSSTTAKDSWGTGPVERLWRFLLARLWPAPIATADALKRFAEERAAFIAQKCAIDYCRGKTGLASYALFTEKPFLDALDVCRWETFVAVLSDLLIMAEGRLRAQVAPEHQSRLREALVGVYSCVVVPMPLPAHRARGWGDEIASFAARLDGAGRAKPQLALDVADHSAKRLFDTLPIHSNMRALDEEVVYGAVRFRMVAVSQEMHQRLRAAELAAELLAAQNVTL